MAIKGVVFDLDGTLIDTNWLHAQAFEQAFRDHGYRVGPDRIVQAIGKGGSFIVPDVLGQEAEERHGDAMRSAKDERFEALIEEKGIDILPSAVELLQVMRERGLRTALATGSKKEALEQMMEQADENLIEMVDEVVTDTDVERSKPHSDAVEAAVEKLDLSPVQCMMLGDTPYDALVCRRTGVVMLGVLTGEHPAQRMKDAGARAVYDDVEEVLGRLDEVLRVASPGAAYMTDERVAELMQAALEEAEGALGDGELPVGSVLARSDGTVLARGRARARARHSALAQAEIEALTARDGALDSEVHDLVLVTTLEPSVMGLGAAMEAGVDMIVYAVEAPPSGGTARCRPIERPGASVPRILGGVQKEASRELLARWLDQHPDDEYAQALLGE